ncbi:hypothetical protein SBV1_1150031 [Verrucomicrobia bacterium]|nr:hypothetical protein SBV1_1150031 [Verrucomicrobiota bacterium]
MTPASAPSVRAMQIPGPQQHLSDLSHGVKSRTDPYGQTNTYTYWPDGQIETVTDPLSNVL